MTIESYKINNPLKVKIPLSIIKKLHDKMRIVYIHEKGHMKINSFFNVKPTKIRIFLGKTKEGTIRVVSGECEQNLESHRPILFVLKVLDWLWDVMWLFIDRNKSWNFVMRKAYTKKRKESKFLDL